MAASLKGTDCSTNTYRIRSWSRMDSAMTWMGTAVTQWLRFCATNRKVAGSIPAGVIGIFQSHKILPIALWPWDRHSVKQKWVPGAFPGGKGGRCVRLKTLPPSCAFSMKSGNFNFLLGHSRPVTGLPTDFTDTVNTKVTNNYTLNKLLSSGN